MGIISSSQSITRYTVEGEFEPSAGGVAEQVGRSLVENAIPEVIGEFDEITAGWVPVEAPYDPDFGRHSFIFGAYIVFSLRIDKKSIPAKVLQKEIALAYETKLKETGREFLSKNEKTEIKEAILDRLMRGAQAVPSLFDILWDYEGKTVYLFSSQKAASELFETLFLKSFNHRPVRLFPYTMALLQHDIPGLDGIGVAPGLDIASGFIKFAFFGYDFLLWLWWASENEGFAFDDIIECDDGSVIFALGSGLTIERRVQDSAKSKITINRSDEDSGEQEAKISIANGGVIKSMNITATIGSEEYRLTIDAEGMVFKGLKTPVICKNESDDEFEGAIIEKVYLVQKIFGAIDSLFHQFMIERCESWEFGVETKIKDWLSQG